jgi:hypothetical protein
VLLSLGVVYELTNDPYAKIKTENRTSSAVSEPARSEMPSELDYDGIQKAISSNQRLWMPLVQKPKTAAPPPDLKKMTDGLQVVAILSENDELKCIIKDKNTHTVYKKGDKVRELIVDAVTPSHIVLSYKGATIKLTL